MSIILNIDTSSQQANVSLAKDAELLFTLFNNDQKEHASFLQPAIKKLLEMAQIQVHELDAIAVVNGPGSYTGLRVALSSAKGLCYVIKKPLITIGTLPLMARSALMGAGTGERFYDLFCPMIDARRMEVFTAVFNLTLHEIIPPHAMLLGAESFATLLSEHRILFFGTGASKWQLVANNANALFASSFDPLRAMAQLSYDHFNEKLFTELAYSEPFYLKAFHTGK